jgi:hypothetical protein
MIPMVATVAGAFYAYQPLTFTVMHAYICRGPVVVVAASWADSGMCFVMLYSKK